MNRLRRLDLRSDHEKQDTIEDILGIIIPETKDMFACEMIATRAVSIAKERIQAFEHMGFCLSEEALPEQYHCGLFHILCKRCVGQSCVLWQACFWQMKE